MGWTKHPDAVAAHERELRRTNKAMRRLLKGVTRMSPLSAVQAWKDMKSYAKMKHALSGTSRNANEMTVDLDQVLNALENFDGHIKITFKDNKVTITRR